MKPCFSPAVAQRSISCMRCGLCLAVCPTYHAQGTEAFSPRGRTALARACAEGKLPLSKNLAHHIYACLDCLACTEVCPSGVRVAELILAARAELSPSWPKRLFLDHVLPFPGRLELLLRPLRLYQRSGAQAALRRSKMAEALSPRLTDADYLLPRLPDRALRSELPEVVPPRGNKRGRVGYFLGCAHDAVLTGVGRATVAVLAASGWEVVIPRNLKCCGMPHHAYGEVEEAKKLARHNIAVFQEARVEAIITDCATCGSFARGYGDLLEDDPDHAQLACSFSERVQDVGKFLAENSPPKQNLAPVEGRVTYHDPCHLGRGQGVREEPRHLLGLIPGLEFVELEEADWCCGGAGAYGLENYDLSMKILDRKMAHVSATGADIIATGCPACMLQLRLGVKRQGLGARVAHPVELLAEAYGLS